jgi:hypothetical protein
LRRALNAPIDSKPVLLTLCKRPLRGSDTLSNGRGLDGVATGSFDPGCVKTLVVV